MKQEVRLKDWIQDAINYWNSAEVKLNPPATILQIEATEQILNFTFPDDFKELYLTVDGFAEWDMQGHDFSFWPLQRIIDEFRESDNEAFIGFSDWLIRCHCIGFMKNENGIFKDKVYFIGDRPENIGRIVTSKDHNGTLKQYLNVIDKIAETFEEAVLMINSGADLIY